MNRLSTAGFVPPSVYIGFRLFVLLQRRSGDLSMSWGRTVLSASLPGSASPRHRAPRPDALVVCPVFGFDKCVYIGFRLFRCSCFWRDAQATFLRPLGGYTGLVFPGRTGLLAPNPARPRPAVPPGAPTRPARGMSGFWIRQVFFLHRLCMPRVSRDYKETAHW